MVALKIGSQNLEIVLPYATDFLKLYAKNEQESFESIGHLLTHPFVAWINSTPHNGFIEAYEVIIMHTSINSNTNNHIKLFFDLQFIYANTIHFIVGFKKHAGKKKFNDDVAPKYRDRSVLRTTIKKVLGKLNLGFGGVPSKIESKIHLLQKLHADILTENSRNIFNATSAHSYVLREIMTKRIIQELFLTYWKYDLEPTFISNTTLKMVSVFFNPMDSSDAAEWAKEIKIVIEKEYQYKQQTIGDYIGLPS